MLVYITTSRVERQTEGGRQRAREREREGGDQWSKGDGVGDGRERGGGGWQTPGKP